jgi:hypothetical protein
MARVLKEWERRTSNAILSAPDAISGLIVTGSRIGYTDDEM